MSIISPTEALRLFRTARDEIKATAAKRREQPVMWWRFHYYRWHSMHRANPLRIYHRIMIGRMSSFAKAKGLAGECVHRG